MKDAIKLNISGIKCDACDYKDMSVKVEEYPKWVNKPCPKCEANLLTESDFNNVQKMIEQVEEFNRTNQKRTVGGKNIRMTAEMNGTGSVDFNIKE